MRKVVISGMVGNGLEWYAYALYGHFATLFGKLFFPSENPMISMIATLGVFAAGFLMRPLGAIVFARIGDKYGRKFSLSLSILMIAVLTTSIGLLPTYEQAGAFAPVMLTIIILLQALSLGGEFSSCISFLGEHAKDHNRGLVASTSMFSMCLGILLASAVAFYIANTLPVEELEAWGWRLPFVASIFIGAIGYYIRLHVHESPKYLAAKADGQLSEKPIRELFKHNKIGFFTGFALYLSVTVPFYCLIVFMNSFMTTIVGKTREDSLTINTVAILFLTAFILVSGHLSDKYGRKPVLTVALVGIFASCYPVFWSLEQPGLLIPMIGQSVFAIFVAMFIGPIPATLVELFPTKLRSTGLALSYNIPVALFGGTTPVFGFWLIKHFDFNASLAFYIMAINLVTLTALFFTFKDKFNQPLR